MAGWADALFKVPPPKRKYGPYPKRRNHGRCPICKSTKTIHVGQKLYELDGLEIVPHLCKKPLPQGPS